MAFSELTLNFPHAHSPIARSQPPKGWELGFRHFFRNAYAMDLDGGRLQELRLCALALVPLVSEDLARFDKFLAEAATS